MKFVDVKIEVRRRYSQESLVLCIQNLMKTRQMVYSVILRNKQKDGRGLDIRRSFLLLKERLNQPCILFSGRVSCDWHDKRRLFPYTTLTGWSL
jgi:hypothetical protein